MLAVPVVKVFHVCHFVYPSFWLQNVRVVRQQALVYYSSAVVYFLEVGICEANKHLLDAFFFEVIVQSFHGVCSYNADVKAFLIAAVDSESVYLLSHEIGNFISDFLTKDQVVWIVF